MCTLKNYTTPTIEILLITDDVVRTSWGLGEGELPIQPWWGA